MANAKTPKGSSAAPGAPTGKSVKPAKAATPPAAPVQPKPVAAAKPTAAQPVLPPVAAPALPAPVATQPAPLPPVIAKPKVAPPAPAAILPVESAPAPAKPPLLSLVPASLVAAKVPDARDLLDFGQANVAALVAAGSGLSLAMQQVAQALLQWSHTQFNDSLAAGQSLIDAKSLQDLVELTGAATTSSVDKTLAESARLTELSAKLFDQALQPINSRVLATVERLSAFAA